MWLLTDDRGSFFDGVMKSLKANSPTSMNELRHFRNDVTQNLESKKVSERTTRSASYPHITFTRFCAELICLDLVSKKTVSYVLRKDRTSSERCLDFGVLVRLTVAQMILSLGIHPPLAVSSRTKWPDADHGPHCARIRNVLKFQNHTTLEKTSRTERNADQAVFFRKKYLLRFS